MFVMDYYGHKLSNGVLFAHHLILDVPGGSSHLGYRRRVPPGHNPRTRVRVKKEALEIGRNHRKGGWGWREWVGGRVSAVQRRKLSRQSIC